MAKRLKNKSSRGGTDRGGNGDYRPDGAAHQIEAPGSRREVGDDQNRDHRHGRCADSTKQLTNDEHGIIGRERKQGRPGSFECEADKQERLATPLSGIISNPRREQRNQDLGTTIKPAINSDAESLLPCAKSWPTTGSMEASANWNRKTQPAKMYRFRFFPRSKMRWNSSLACPCQRYALGRNQFRPSESSQGNKCRDAQRSRAEEYRAVGKILAGQSHQARRQCVAKCVESVVCQFDSTSPADQQDRD